MRNILLVLLLFWGIPVLAQTEQSLSVALAVASDQHKLVLVHFWNERCGPCHLIQNRVFSNKASMSILEKEFVFVKINTDEQDLLTRLYRIDSVPTELMLYPGGKEIIRWNGIADKRYVDEALLQKQEFKNKIRSNNKLGIKNNIGKTNGRTK